MKRIKISFVLLAVILVAASSFTQISASKASFAEGWFIYNGGDELEQTNYTHFVGEPTELCDASDELCAIRATIQVVGGVNRPLETDASPSTISLEDVEDAGGFSAPVSNVSKFKEE